ncbi:MAG: hypothetical protein WDK96_01375 [Candidatus Paceibacterota bacterium]|jgi:hypothetical protein
MTKLLYDLIQILFEKFINDFGTGDIKGFKYNHPNQTGIPCKYRMLKSLNGQDSDEKPVLVFVPKFIENKKSSLMIFDKLPKLGKKNETNDLSNVIAEVLVGEIYCSQPIECFDKIGREHRLALSSRLNAGVMSISQGIKEFSNYYSLVLIQQAYDLYQKDYEWVTGYFKSAHPEIYPFEIRNEKISVVDKVI